MANKTAPLLRKTEELLLQLGARLRLARLRRRLTAKQVAERAGMAPMTLRGVERGGAGVTVGAYLAVMQVLGVEKDLNLLAAADPLGRDLQDARLTSRGAKSPTNPSPLAISQKPDARHTATKAAKRSSKTLATLPPPKSGDWIRKGGFSSAEDLVRLIAAPKSSANKKR